MSYKPVNDKTLAGINYDAKERFDPVFGYKLNSQGVPEREAINLKSKEDYGADPIGNGQFRMVPSGDVVNLEERNRRLKK